MLRDLESKGRDGSIMGDDDDEYDGVGGGGEFISCV